MIRKLFRVAALIAVSVTTAYAAGSDNAATPRSYFEGVWVGSWSSSYTPGIRQDITVTIERGQKEGDFLVEYSWGLVEYKNRTVYPGSFKTRGHQQEDEFSFQWKTRQGNENRITLQKESENKVKARLDRGGTLPPNETPTSETHLTRK